MMLGTKKRPFHWRSLARWFIPILGLGLLAACTEDDSSSSDSGDPAMLMAKQIESQDELIGGPTARGKVGDFLIQNDKVRFIIAGQGQAWMGGVFGGTLLDADLVRKRSDSRYGQGWDAFGETFPLVNLVVANPSMPGRGLEMSESTVKLVPVESGIQVLNDGSDGEAAVVRVVGRSGYIFEMLKFLDKEFLSSFLATPISLAGFSAPVDQLLDTFLGVNVYALINRLQLDFQFFNYYILKPGDNYLTIKTVVVTSPPTEGQMDKCPNLAACDLQCDNGFSLQEYTFDIEGQTLKGKAMCPLCECAEGEVAMDSLNESEDIFKIMLGDLGPWKDPLWKGGLLGGDFLFFGSESNIFSPGLGFDDSRKIFNNMWEEVPTLASPIVFDWIATRGENVSYGWVTKNPDRREGFDCPSQRMAITDLQYSDEQEMVRILVDDFGLSEGFAQGRVRQVIVDRRPIFLREIPMEADSAADFSAWKQDMLENLSVSDDNPATIASLMPPTARLDLIDATECLSSKLLIPLFSTSATAVMTHKSPSVMKYANQDDPEAPLYMVPIDSQRVFAFERYFVVGEGDVGSVLGTVFKIKETPHGFIKGTVMDEARFTPQSHVSVFLIQDPRPYLTGVADMEEQVKTYDGLSALCRKAFKNTGLISQMDTDVGLDPVADGQFHGPVPPGDYFVFAFSPKQGISRPEPITIKEGETQVVNLTIPVAGKVKYRVQDQSGMTVPCRLTFAPLDQDGKTYPWDLMNRVELGGSRYEHGILKKELSSSGVGEVTLPAGKYDVTVTRGFEFGRTHYESFEVKSGQTVALDATLLREIDTAGYISGDFHMHAIPSIDASLPLDDRLTALASEGVELVASTDHDYLTDYRPIVNELDLHKFIKTMVGVETTTLEFGHYNGYPLKYDDTKLPVHEPPPWFGETITTVWAMLRDMISPSAKDMIVQVNHPRDGMMGYFAQFGLIGYSLERKTPGMSMCNPQTEKIPCNFDIMEIMNEKRFELLRTPTIGEVAMHNKCFKQILGATDPALFSMDSADDPSTAVCAELQVDPFDDCDARLATAWDQAMDPMELALARSDADHCTWHREFREHMTLCEPDSELLICKKLALDGLKLLSVRYMMERLPAEQDAYFSTTPETDIGCKLEDAMAGCLPNQAEDGAFVGGCTEKECFCQPCVCETHPECCLDPEETDEAGVIGTGWTQACVDICAGPCHGCGVQPCTSSQQIWDDWFSLLNAGFPITVVGNSDSHDVKSEVGLPRNYVPSSTDDPYLIDVDEIVRNMKAGKVMISTGPFLDVKVNGAGLGETVTKPSGDKLKLSIRIQTPSWFGIDRIEIHRNARLERIIRVDAKPEEIVDIDQVIELDMPQEDSWFVVLAYGLSTPNLMSPTYQQIPLGKMFVSTVIAMGANSILSSFQELLDEVEKSLGGFLGEGGVAGLLGGLFGSGELPDSFPMFPLAVTNPIWVDVDGGGVKPINARDANGDNVWDLPPFCSGPCEVEWIQDGDKEIPGQSGCGLNQVCVPDSEGSTTGTCQIPIPENCMGEQV